ncbi:MAG: ribonuclease HII [Gemmatimonadetes bacterium]|nr:ribonuclease HII [Gemmatimonadota bacterium]
MTGPGTGKGRKRRGPRTASGRRRAEKRRLERLLALEREYWDTGIQWVAGVDEVGRGPLAGPVLAAAVILPPNVAIKGIDDSKRLPPERREALYHEIRAHALCIGIGAASTREIDRLNILRASWLAMQRAVARLRIRPERIIIDGLPVPVFGDEHRAVVDGDAHVHCVACASVIAKVVRDRLMRRLAPRYPGYGWDENCGYATAEHRSAIVELGMTAHHRRSFELNTQLGFDLFD